LWFMWLQIAAARKWTTPVLGGLLMVDLLWFGWGRAAQIAPEYYYPKIPAIEAIKTATPGRVIGYNCLPATVTYLAGLQDIRGYDAIDPARLIELLARAADANSIIVPYAYSQMLAPKIRFDDAGKLQLSPIMDFLGVRYVIARERLSSSAPPRFESTDYFVYENTRALPRVFVPKRVEAEPDKEKRLARLAEENFDPAELAIVEEPVVLATNSTGSASIQDETPTHLRIKCTMQTEGLVVLADLWDKGWEATIDGVQANLLRVNHALRGVVVPKNQTVVELRYRPMTLRIGYWSAVFALVGLGGWSWFAAGQNRRPPATE
jgi:hypothetical protein